MRYDTSQLSERLAADYVLGTMPRRARSRFERVVARDATLAARVAAWAERLKPLDNDTEEQMPPARVWRAIERQIGFAHIPAGPRPWFGGVTLWRGFGAAALAACAVAAVCVVVKPPALTKLAADLADKTGLAGWSVAAPPHAGDVGLSLMDLGISTRERPRWLRAALLLTSEGKMAITLEPPAPPR
ncbi:MAG: hypothetical protein JO032_03715 [Alphaproteobacteria bacterium]|nr:hypothetical protein [Alphaproteobacteria bacterium]